MARKRRQPYGFNTAAAASRTKWASSWRSRILTAHLVAAGAWSRHRSSSWSRGLANMAGTSMGNGSGSSSNNARPKPVALIILDGFGLRGEIHGNAVAQANKPNYDRYMANYPHTTLTACGEAV